MLLPYCSPWLWLAGWLSPSSVRFVPFHTTSKTLKLSVEWICGMLNRKEFEASDYAREGRSEGSFYTHVDASDVAHSDNDWVYSDQTGIYITRNRHLPYCYNNYT